MKQFYSAIFLVYIASIFCLLSLYSQDGKLDPTFGEGGIRTSSFDISGNSVLNSSALQNDAKISVITLARYTDGQITGINDEIANENSDALVVEQNYPNPFNISTKIKYEISISGLVTLKVNKITGQEIKTLVNLNQAMGQYEVDLDSRGLDTGIYFYMLKVGNYVKTRKMILSK